MKTRTIFSSRQLQSSNQKREARDLSAENQGLLEVKLDYLGHGAQCRHKQLVAPEPELLKTIAALHNDFGHALRQLDWRKKHGEPEV